jgi:hypothetical protein
MFGATDRDRPSISNGGADETTICTPLFAVAASPSNGANLRCLATFKSKYLVEFEYDH